MARSKMSPLKRSFLVLLAILIIAAVGVFVFLRSRTWPEIAIPGQTQTNSPLSADDISWLFPAPTRAEDFAKLIALRDLTTPNPQNPAKRDPVWPDPVFQQFLAIAASSAGKVDGTESALGLPSEAQSIDAWYVSGVRIDAGAPGLSHEIRGQFGQLPEIRLIIQPVIHNADGTPKVLDIAGHLIFNFILDQQDAPAQTGCLPRPQPNLPAFQAIVEDLVAMRTKLSEGKLGADRVTTAGVPLGVHPGLTDATTAVKVRDEMKSLLERHLSSGTLDSMAIIGLPSGAAAPWIFLSLQKVPPGVVPALPNGGFVPVHGPTLDGQQFSQLLERIFKFPRVAPTPHTNNLNPITCQNAAVPANPPIAERRGVATADIFGLFPSSTSQIKQTLDVIADPNKSHFFNTDCVSCHTETRRAMELLNVKQIPGIDPAVMPNGTWDVRNFGWSPPAVGPAQATVTRRTAAETAANVTYIDANLFAKPAPPISPTQ
jgi:hypothetical protein